MKYLDLVIDAHNNLRNYLNSHKLIHERPELEFIALQLKRFITVNYERKEGEKKGRNNQ